MRVTVYMPVNLVGSWVLLLRGPFTVLAPHFTWWIFDGGVESMIYWTGLPAPGSVRRMVGTVRRTFGPSCLDASRAGLLLLLYRIAR